MSRMQISLELNARDRTQAAIGSAMSGVKRFASAITRPITVPLRFATSGMGLVGLNMGLRPAVEAIDGLIERGTRLQVVRQAFGGLTRLGGKELDALGRHIQAASNGVLGLGRAMAVANRGLAAGLNVGQLEKIIDFATKKAVTVGESPAELVQKLVEAIATGKTRALDDLGLLRDGVEGVAEAFDRANGAGAFARLSESAKVQQVAAQVIRDMAVQQRTLTVRGKEAFFVWARIKTEIGDSVDRLVLAVTQSKAMSAALSGLRDLLGGITRHFEQGGTIGQLLTGKGQSGGLLGLAGAALVDAGANLGRGIAASLLDAGAWLMDRLPQALGWVWERGQKLIDAAEAAARRIIQETKKSLGLGGGVTSWFFGQPTKSKFEFLKGIPEMMTHPMANAIGLKGAEPGSTFALLGAVLRSVLPPALMRPRTPGPRASADGPAGLPAGPLGVGLMGANMAYGAFGVAPPAMTFAGQMRQAAAGFRTNLGWGGAGAAYRSFAGEFAGDSAEQQVAGDAAVNALETRERRRAFLSGATRFGLRPGARRRFSARIDATGNLERRRGLQLRVDARRAAAEEANRLRRMGFDIGADERQSIESARWRELINQDPAIAALRNERRVRTDVLRGDAARREGGTGSPGRWEELIAALHSLIKQLGGYEGEVQRAAG